MLLLRAKIAFTLQYYAEAFRHLFTSGISNLTQRCGISVKINKFMNQVLYYSKSFVFPGWRRNQQQSPISFIINCNQVQSHCRRPRYLQYGYICLRSAVYAVMDNTLYYLQFLCFCLADFILSIALSRTRAISGAYRNETQEGIMRED